MMASMGVSRSAIPARMARSIGLRFRRRGSRHSGRGPPHPAGVGWQEHLEILQDIAAVDDQFGAVLDRAGCSQSSWAGQWGRARRKRSALFHGLVGGDQGAAARRSLDHQDSLAHSAYDPVAQGKRLAVRNVRTGNCRDHRSVAQFRDPVGEGPVFRRVEVADAGSRTATVRPPAANAASWAKVSMPRARPDTTVSPAWASWKPSFRAVSRP